MPEGTGKPPKLIIKLRQVKSVIDMYQDQEKKKELRAKNDKILTRPLVCCNEDRGEIQLPDPKDKNLLSKVLAFFENGDQMDQETCLMMLQQMEGNNFAINADSQVELKLGNMRASTLHVLKHYMDNKDSFFANVEKTHRKED